MQAYDSEELDASLLLMPLVGFLPGSDPRVKSTVEAIERELMPDGLVLRYDTSKVQDGLPPGEGVFLACSFWMVSSLKAIGRLDDARALFERLLTLRNDLGLLSEEYDVDRKRLVGNFPQAFSHIALVNAAFDLEDGPDARSRSHRQKSPRVVRAPSPELGAPFLVRRRTARGRAIDIQFYSFTCTGGNTHFDLNYRLQLTQDNADTGAIPQMLTVRKGPFRGSKRFITNRIASGVSGFCPRPHFDPLFHLHCGKTDR